MSGQSMVPLARWRAGSHIYSIAVSFDGTQVVSGSDNNQIRVWDVRTGALVFALQGHTRWVQSVAFSHDGTLIVSGSQDNTIRLWNAVTGTPIGEPLKGHTQGIFSVAFSPEGARIVSGSHDSTIRIWDVRTGSSIGRPLTGHVGTVYSVSFSPDGTHILSSSNDRTIRIWDIRARTPISYPLKGHNDAINSVVFSPDSTRIVSGSNDRTIRIWDVNTGTPIGAPLKGHTSYVKSVAFSSDSTRIVSGSWDHTIRIWDARTGTPIGEPLMGHTDDVYSVAFLPNCTRIVSGSWDGTICVWGILQNAPSFDIVTSKMSAQEMFECLVRHGCTDLTSVTDPDRLSSSVVASGGFGDVRRVTRDDGTIVAVKTLRLQFLLQGDDKAAKRAVREVYVWSRLHHPNVQELLGIVVFQGALGMVSPWMKQGNLQQYIAAHPDVERYPLCVQVASGVSYLHSIDMVHGDLKANNVLVSDDGTLKINDFDHAILSDTTLRFSTTTRPGGGTLRWMAPELFQSEDEGEEGQGYLGDTRNKQTDVYALGMTMLEIITGTVPYSEYRTDPGVIRALDRKQAPRRPKELSGPDGRADTMWKLLLECWDHNPVARPIAATVLKSLDFNQPLTPIKAQPKSSSHHTPWFARLRRIYKRIFR